MTHYARVLAMERAWRDGQPWSPEELFTIAKLALQEPDPYRWRRGLEKLLQKEWAVGFYKGEREDGGLTWKNEFVLSVEEWGLVHPLIRDFLAAEKRNNPGPIEG